MTALPLLAGALLASAFAACGGDSNDEPTPTTAAPANGGAEATATPRTPQPRATPTPKAEDSIALNVGGRGAQTPFAPTVAEFKALPTTTIKGKTGVTLATLLEKAGRGSSTIATIAGTSPTGLQGGAIRYPIDTIAANTIFVMDANGHITMASDHVPENEWLIAIENVTIE